MSYLFDTNVVIYFLGKVVLSNDALAHFDSICAEGANISIITKLELLGYNFDNAITEDATSKFVSRSLVCQISPEIEEETIRLRKTLKIKLRDAIIAATAIVNDLTLISANIKDFQSIPHLKLLNPLAL